MAEREMPRSRAFIASGEHAAAVQCRNTEGIGGFSRRPIQKLRARGSDTEGSADRARPPAARKQFWRIDAEADSNNCFVAGDRSFNHFPTATAVFFCHSDQRWNHQPADACS